MHNIYTINNKSIDQIELTCCAKTINISGRENPFNASILKTRFGYLLSYRISNSTHYCYTEEFIECCYLDYAFCQISDSYPLQLESGADEDPRLIMFNERIGLVYGGPANNPWNPYERTLYLSELILDRRSIMVKRGSAIKLTHNTKQKICEKNWTPFVFKDKLLLTYSICPHEILKINPNGLCQLKYISYNHIALQGDGGLRGGTPAVKISDTEYMAFFHSFINPPMDTYDPDDIQHLQKTGLPLRNYIMGCYTFECGPPFRLLRYSAGPLLYPGIFDSTNPRIPRHKVVFPSGLIVENGKVHVSCGENDACIKVVTFDLEELLSSLVEVMAPITSVR